MNGARRITVPVALMAGFLTASAGASEADCAEVPCESVRHNETPKSDRETPIELDKNILASGANRAPEPRPMLQMSCCYDRLTMNEASQAYSQRLDDVLLAFFFWLSVIACLLALAVFVVLGVNVYTLTKEPGHPQRAPVVSVAVVRPGRSSVRALGQS